MRIVSDTATLYSPEEGNKIGATILPVYVSVNGKEYRDYVDIGSEEFLALIQNGGVPSSSQPSIGDIIEVFEEGHEEILLLSVGDGLSGAYQNAVGAKNSIADNGHIHVIDTKTLAGAQRYLLEKAIKLYREGCHIKRIKEELAECIESSRSFVIPVDFEFLKRSGRLTPLAAKIGSLIKIVPVMTQTEDKKRIMTFAIKRSGKKAVEAIIEYFKSLNINEGYLISVGHAGVAEKAADILGQMKEQFKNASFELLELSPSLITHGGPGCVTVQVIKK